MTIDFTTNPDRRSFVPVAEDSHFPIQNLPLGVFQTRQGNHIACCTAIGDYVVDLSILEDESLLPAIAPRAVFNQASLNEFASLGRGAWRAVRAALSELLDANQPRLRDNPALRERVFHRQQDVCMQLPMSIGDYTDFYSSKAHATNVGTMFRGADNALQPNWLHLPVAYHGRSSSIVVSGTPIRRPSGQTFPANADAPVFGSCQAMDFELEMGFFIGPSTSLGSAIPVDQADEHIFGMTLVNDWSARDIQRWEYVPLGPFLGKNFATSVSPWIISLDALEPFRCLAPVQEPTPLAYLKSSNPYSFDIKLEVALQTENCSDPFVISRSNFANLYWTMQQQLAHHTCNGCNVRPGDLLASGTISGDTPESLGSLLEISWKGERPLQLPNGESRTMLLDGDSVLMSGWAQGDGYRIGFGEVNGEIQANG